MYRLKRRELRKSERSASIVTGMRQCITVGYCKYFSHVFLELGHFLTEHQPHSCMLSYSSELHAGLSCRQTSCEIWHRCFFGCLSFTCKASPAKQIHLTGVLQAHQTCQAPADACCKA